MGLFGPKKIEGKGTPIAAEELRAKLLQLFPQKGEVNPQLAIEPNEKYPFGFVATWKMYTKERQENNSFKFDYFQFTFTVDVDIDPKEKIVHLKAKEFSKSARVPDGEPVYEPWYGQVRIGQWEDVQGEVKQTGLVKTYTFSHKKLLDPLVESSAQHGWSVII